MKLKLPIRKVISAYRCKSITDNYFCCKLDCGHEAIAYGKKKSIFDAFGEAPKTCSCRRCYHEQEKAK